LCHRPLDPLLDRPHVCHRCATGCDGQVARPRPARIWPFVVLGLIAVGWLSGWVAQIAGLVWEEWHRGR
jgi:hypothetical protein